MKKLAIILLASTLVTPTLAGPPVIPPVIPPIMPPVMHAPKPLPVPPGASSSAAGAAAVTGFLGFVAVLVLYDIWRRNSCYGDVLHLGGPGFSSPPLPYTNVMSTARERGLCGAAPRRVIRVRG